MTMENLPRTSRSPSADGSTRAPMAASHVPLQERAGTTDTTGTPISPPPAITSSAEQLQAAEPRGRRSPQVSAGMNAAKPQPTVQIEMSPTLYNRATSTGQDFRTAA